MGIFDALTGAAGHQAADNSRLTLASIIPNLSTAAGSAYGSAGDLLKSGYGQAGIDLGTGYGTATGAIRGGAGGALDYLDQGTGGALDQLGQARGALTAGGGAFASLGDLASRYGAGARLYSDSLGINGPEGNQRAVDAFQRGPGYQAGLDTGVDAITRAANASGNIGGNSLRDTIKFGVNYSNQDYNKYLDRLSGFNPLELSATSGAATGNAGINNAVAGTYGAGAGVLDSAGKARAGVATGEGTALSDLARSYYGSLAGKDVSGGAALAGNTIAGNANNQNLFLGAIPQWNNTFKQDADASNAASANSLNLGMNLAKLGVGAAGGASGGGLWSPGGIFGGFGGDAGAAGAFDVGKLLAGK